MEVLSDILQSMHVQGSVFFCDRLDVPWKLDFHDTGSASFHMVRRGECWVSSDEALVQMGPGDLVFVEPGRDHELQSHPPGHDPVRGSCTVLLCGYCKFRHDVRTPLAAVFPDLTVVRDDEIHRHTWLRATLDQLACEFTSNQPGAELVIDKLTEIVIVELIRISFGRTTADPFVHALTDEQISAALALLHDGTERQWTLQSLAAEVGMSRAAFAKKFKRLVGQPMFEYLTALRVQKARELLRETSLPVYEIAERVGYHSDLAFTKTFKKAVGMTPTRYRKSANPV